jgi:hypothetical protein
MPASQVVTRRARRGLLVAASDDDPATGRRMLTGCHLRVCRAFYQHFGFTAAPRPERLVRKVSDIEADTKN